MLPKVEATTGDKMKYFFFIFFISHTIFAFQPIQIIDSPTAGLLNKKVYIIDIRNYSPNELHADCQYSPLTRLQIGISYGASNLIGNDTVTTNRSKVGLKLKLRPLEEGIYNPAVAIGINTQGYGIIVENNYDYKRFLYKSDGAYITISKSYMIWMFMLGIHGTVNYTFEKETLPPFLSGLNYTVATDFGLLSNLYLLSEYDFLVDEKDYEDNYIDHSGLLNLGVRWNVINNFSVSFHLKDVLGVNKELHFVETSLDREFRLTYFNSF